MTSTRLPACFRREPNCGGDVGGYGGYEPTDSPVGRIEIISMTEDCVVGKVHYLEFGAPELAEVTGGFVAQRCHAP
jgi:hypothetical protein